MRSVIVHLIDAPSDCVRETLSKFSPQQVPQQWLYPSVDAPSLYIEIISNHADLEYTSEQNEVIQEALGKPPDISVLADVSGRVPGDTEVRAFVECLLTRFRGVANDEFTNHYWTLDEIRSNARFQGHPFFDYEGWFLNFRKQREAWENNSTNGDEI